MIRDPRSYPYTATYKDRTLDPGVHLVLEINWEAGNAQIVNGSCRCFPDLDEITLAENPDYEVLNGT